MKQTVFTNYLKRIDSLNTRQYRELKEKIEKKDSIKYVSRAIDDSFDDVKCPHCNSFSIQRWGIRNDLQRYKCKSCKKTFNTLTGTPLAYLHKKGRWLNYSECLKEGLSVRKAATKCGIHRNTSFRWRHRFLYNNKSIKTTSLSGIVEVDETYFLRSEKGSRKLKRKPRKRGAKAKLRGYSNQQVCVFIGRDRAQNTYDKILNRFNSKELSNSLTGILSRDSLLCSDSKSVYKKFTNENNIRHGCLNLSKGEIVKKDIVHIKNVNAYHSRLKGWMRRFNGVATKYLDNYLSWYRCLDEFNMDIDSLTILLRAKSADNYTTNHFR